MVPRGLRWDVHPQQGDPDLDSWFKYFNEAGLWFFYWEKTYTFDDLREGG